MPIQVDVEQRLGDIARATLEVASELGLGGVTIRSVAARLDSSTTVITNYLPTRTDLLANALDLVNDEWIAELDAAASATDPAEALREVMRVAVSMDEADLLRSQFWVAVLSEPHRPESVVEKLRSAATAVRETLADLAAECGLADSAVDPLFLLTQGAFITAVETPGMWGTERLVEAADAFVDALMKGAQSPG